jgi:hypothetical protein
MRGSQKSPNQDRCVSADCAPLADFGTIADWSAGTAPCIAWVHKDLKFPDRGVELDRSRRISATISVQFFKNSVRIPTIAATNSNLIAATIPI